MKWAKKKKNFLIYNNYDVMNEPCREKEAKIFYDKGAETGNCVVIT